MYEQSMGPPRFAVKSDGRPRVLGARGPGRHYPQWMPTPLPRQTRLLGLALSASLVLQPVPLVAQGAPSGTWHTISDVDGKPRGIIALRVVNGVLAGTIAGTLVPGEQPGKVCDKCTDERRGKPLVGMQILRGLRWNGDAWTGGEILDPDTGKTYRATIRLSDDGRALSLRGYIGIALLGRTQRWVRAQ